MNLGFDKDSRLSKNSSGNTLVKIAFGWIAAFREQGLDHPDFDSSAAGETWRLIYRFVTEAVEPG